MIQCIYYYIIIVIMILTQQKESNNCDQLKRVNVIIMLSMSTYLDNWMATREFNNFICHIARPLGDFPA